MPGDFQGEWIMLRRQILLGLAWGLSGWDPVGRRSSSALLPVRLLSQEPDLDQITLIAPFTLAGETFPTGQWQLQVHNQQLFLRGGGQPRHYRRPVLLQHAAGVQAPDREPRRYRGVTQIQAIGENQLALVNWVELEDYLLGVVPGEMPADWPMTALEVQAIVARTHAVPFLTVPRWDSGPPDSFLLDSTADQVYGGVSYESPTTTLAVRSTQGQIVTYNGRPIEALYHSTCGGHTSANQDIFAPPAQPYLQGVACHWCQPSPFFGPHTSYLSKSDLVELFGNYDVEIVRKDPYGRPLEVRVGARHFSGQEFWFTVGQTLGWGLLPSNRYSLTPSGDLFAYRLTYQGAGHGVGLCQWGARGQALAGESTAAILSYYYPDTRIQSVSSLAVGLLPELRGVST